MNTCKQHGAFDEPACPECAAGWEVARPTPNQYGEVAIPPDSAVVFEDGEIRYTAWVEDGVLHVRTHPNRVVILPVVSNEIIVGQTD